ncbi:MAG: exodeoxyribonuclease III [Caulobacterales bacterium]|nr:exodeoxyribonuclease III [Caulobacterales bacterium]
MKLASWNVNSINARLPTILAWLSEAAPDVACLQETKCVDEKFPREALEDLGYNAAAHGQKTYNGVAILSKLPIEETIAGLPGDESDEQARYLEAVIAADSGPVRVASIYLPNGNPIGGEKFAYKLAWMARLRAHARGLLAYEEPLALAGDYNVIPRPEDVHDPAAWAGDALFQPESRAGLRALIHEGFTDAFETLDGRGGQYTFWDYQGGAWPKDHGIRIDHVLLSPQAADRLEEVAIARDARAMEKPSDHVPITVSLAV